MELSHGGALKARHYCRAGAERCGARGPGDDGDYPGYMRSLRIHAVVTPLHEDTVEQARPLVRTLLFAVFVVLLSACANLAGLQLVRAIRR